MKGMKVAAVLPHLKAWRGIPKGMAKEGKPVEYKDGRVYLNRGCFRAICHVPSGYATEKRINIAKYANVDQAWLYALKAIDDYEV